MSDTQSENQASPSPPGDDTRVIYDKGDLMGHVRIAETTDKCRAYITVTAGESEEKLAMADVRDIATELGITEGLKAAAVEESLATLAGTGDTCGPILLAEGSPAVDGEDGRFELFFGKEDPYVDKGELLLRVVGATPGTAGKNIYGNVIEPSAGTTPEISLGPNVASGNPGEYVSEVFGRVVLEKDFLAVNKAIEVSVDEDAMTARLTYNCPHPLTRERVEEELAADKITHGIDNQTIDAVVSASQENAAPVLGLVIAEGTPVREGEDGSISFAFETESGPHFTENVDGSVDLRETNVIQSVAEGQSIAVLTPHVDPVPGTTVYGKSIQPQPVKQVSLLAGKNVVVSDDGCTFIAEKSGRPNYDGYTVCVADVLTIDGDLDMSIGNIDFDGEVEINGDVEDGYTIKSTKSILIRGFVGATNIESGLDIVIEGGCNGNNKSRIIAGREIRARYINGAIVKASGDVIVTSEIISSSVDSLGRVTVLEGKICGARVRAKKGIESYDVGSEYGVETVLRPGVDYDLKDRCKKIDAGIAEKNAELEKVQHIIEPLHEKPELLEKMPSAQREKYDQTLRYIESLNAEKASLETCKHNMITEGLADAVTEVIVHHNAWQGVRIKTGMFRREIASVLEGPMRLYESPENETISVEPLHREKDSAQEKETEGEETGNTEPETTDQDGEDF